MTPEIESVAQTSEDGILVWSPALDRVTFEIRHMRTVVHAVFHLFLAALTLGLFAMAVWAFINQDPMTDVFTIQYVFSGASSIFWFSLAVLSSCFLAFRLSAYGEQVLPLPRWGFTQSQIKKLEGKSSMVERDISRHFNDASWETLRFAYDLAVKTGKVELRPIHLFAAALSGPAGGIFMTRLGVDFEKIKEGITTMVREGEQGEPVVVSEAAKRVLIDAYVSASESRRKHVGPIEIFLASYNVDERLQDVRRLSADACSSCGKLGTTSGTVTRRAVPIPRVGETQARHGHEPLDDGA